jgi:hypothetical protein
MSALSCPMLKATDCTFDEMRTIASSTRDFTISLSYFQVEFGLAHTESLWNMFTEISVCDEEVFESKLKICLKFSEALSDYWEISSDTKVFPVDCPIVN